MKSGRGPACRLRRVSCGKLRFRSIVRSVDNGLPLIWALYSSPAYLERLKEVTALRGKSGTPAQWKAKLKKLRKIPQSQDDGHVCLIIGYNAMTDEIAVSNSWGPGAEIAWVRFADAAIADQGEDLYTLQLR